jgi:long-chain acyl-CoA synthetase
MRNLIERINVGDCLTRSAWHRPDKLAVVDGDRHWTYRQFNAWVNQIANGLAAAGHTRGDALGLASGNSAEFLAVYYACAKLGVACVPLNLGWRAEEIAYVLGHSRTRTVALESQLVDALAPALADTPCVTDVVVLPGLGEAYATEPVGRPWVQLDELLSWTAPSRK